MRSAGAVAAVALVVVLGAAAAYRVLWEHGGGKPVAWRDVSASLQEPLLTRPAGRLFHDRSDLATYLRREDATRPPSLPRVDFGRDDVVLLSSGPRSSTGYSVRVVSVVAERGRLRVTARE